MFHHIDLSVSLKVRIQSPLSSLFKLLLDNFYQNYATVYLVVFLKIVLLFDNCKSKLTSIIHLFAKVIELPINEFII